MSNEQSWVYLFVDYTFQILLGRRSENAENVIQLIQIVFPGKYRPIRQHFRQNTTHRPDVDGFCVSLRVEHDFRRSIPSRRHVFRQKACMIVIWIGHSSQTEIANLPKGKKTKKKKIIRFHFCTRIIQRDAIKNYQMTKGQGTKNVRIRDFPLIGVWFLLSQFKNAIFFELLSFT